MCQTGVDFTQNLCCLPADHLNAGFGILAAGHLSNQIVVPAKHPGQQDDPAVFVRFFTGTDFIPEQTADEHLR